MAASEVKSVATRRFWALLHVLPEDIQNLAAKNYQLWRNNPQHPSLHFRRLQGSADRYTVRVGSHYRAIGFLKTDMMIWVWIGTHTEYDRLVSL